MLVAMVVLAHCGGTVHEQTSAELGPICDRSKPADCPIKNDCQVCVYIGASGGLCGYGCKSNADCGAGFSCRFTRDYSVVGPCTKWADQGYCAEEHAAFGKLCAKVDDCEKTSTGCGICGQAKDDSAYRCRKACSSDTECTAPQKCATPPATAAFVSLSACDKPERWCQ